MGDLCPDCGKVHGNEGAHVSIIQMNPAWLHVAQVISVAQQEIDKLPAPKKDAAEQAVMELGNKVEMLFEGQPNVICTMVIFLLCMRLVDDLEQHARDNLAQMPESRFHRSG